MQQYRTGSEDSGSSTDRYSTDRKHISKNEERAKVEAGNTFILVQSEDVVCEGREMAVNKYQSGEMIMAEVIGQCAQAGEPEKLFLGSGRRQDVRIIGIFSPVHRSKKTGYALQMGKRLAKTQNVLYLNLEVYGGIGGHFPGNGQTIADALYYARQEKKHLRAALAGMVNIWGRWIISCLCGCRKI